MREHDTAGGIHFSPDTAPAGLAVVRPLWLTPMLAAVFALCALAINPFMPRLTFAYGRLIAHVSGAERSLLPKQASFAVRPFLLLLLILVALFLTGATRARLEFAFRGIALFALFTVGVDTIVASLTRIGGPSPFSAVGNVLAAVAGLVALGVSLFTSVRLPTKVTIRARLHRSNRFLWTLASSALISVGLVYLLLHVARHVFQQMSTVPLLGGSLSPWLLVFMTLPVVLVFRGLAASRERTTSRLGEEADDHASPSVAVLIPARNEAKVISDTIKALDVAAGSYAGRCRIYVIENGSSDGTRSEAKRALSRCRNVRGLVLSADGSGKAHALNIGLQKATEDIVLRVDADTLVSAAALSRLMGHFRDPTVGGVGGVPLPKERSNWIEGMRAIEVLFGVCFKRLGQAAVDAVTVLPGMTVAFRRDLLVDLNGFAEGINGEDADVTVRVGRLGYQIVSDPRAIVHTEVPPTFLSLREQRIRWGRGLFHMVGRNSSAIWMRQGIRGVWQIPWACLVMFRKLALFPFAILAVTLLVANRSVVPLGEVAAIGAILLGLQLILMALVLIALGEASLILALPGYLLFRLVLAYIAIDMLLTLPLDDSKERGRFIEKVRERLSIPAVRSLPSWGLARPRPVEL
jgi:cellulose synthase/poly-beta-1,6-N-acetylglucosamine synthase-like glycosyltransferase